MPRNKPAGVLRFHLSAIFVLLALNIISVSSPTFDWHICFSAQGSGAGSKKDPGAAGRSVFTLRKAGAELKEDRAGRKDLIRFLLKPASKSFIAHPETAPHTSNVSVACLRAWHQSS